MLEGKRRYQTRRGSFGWLVFTLGFFLFLLLLAWQRVEHRERNGRIRICDRALREKRTDATLLKFELEQRTNHLAVQQAAASRGLVSAGGQSRIALTVDTWRPPEPETAPPFQTVVDWVTHNARVRIAEARSEPGGSDDASGSW